MCGSYMFEFSVSKDMEKKITLIRRLPTNLLTYLLTPVVKKLEISIEQGKVVTTLNTIKHKYPI